MKSFSPHPHEVEFFVENGELKFKCSKLKFWLDGDVISIKDILNDDTVKLIYDNGITYLNGAFYKFTLPTDDAKISADFFSRFIDLPSLQVKDLSEKDEDGLSITQFSSSSIFYLIDQLSNISNTNVQLSQLGDLYQFIPNVDLILCTDMDTEPADFVLSSKDKLVYVHVKCGKAEKPQSSAGALYQVGSQAIKNIHYLISNNRELQYANLTRLNNPWPALNGNSNKISLNSRIRLFNKKFDLNHKLTDVLSKINDRRSEALVKKEIWIIVGNGFSLSHFKKQFSESTINKSQESMQAYQIIDSWLLQTKSLGVELKFFVSP